jgi:sugar lactone lactonase YvrE
MLVFRKKYPFDGSDDEVIDVDNSYPYGIAIDMESDHLYWSEYSSRKLYRSDLDGSNRTEIVTGLIDPAEITLDTVNK